MNRIKENKDKNFLNSFSAHYIYEFESGVWDLEKREVTESKLLKLHNGENVIHTTAFPNLIKNFIVNLRENIYGEKFEDLYMLPLKDGEKVSFLIEQEEREELARLNKKYGSK